MADASLEKMVAYTTWANQAWAKHIHRYPGDSYLLKMLSHIARAEQTWFQRIHAVPVDGGLWDTLALQQVEDLLLSNAQVYYALLQGDVSNMISYTRLNGDAHTSAVSDILLHLCAHAAHHRGQMASHASMRGFDVINTDFINFCRAIKK